MDPQDDLASLCALVQRMVEESGNPEGFDARAWLEHWMSQEIPALGFRRPADLLKEPAGFDHVETTLRRMQSGAYS